MKNKILLTSLVLAGIILGACAPGVPAESRNYPSTTEGLVPPQAPFAASITQDAQSTPYPPDMSATEPAGVPPYPAVSTGQAGVTPYPAASTSPAVETMVPSVQAEATATSQVTQVIAIPTSVYTCKLEGTKLPVWRFEVVQAYPHDPTAYTQGLIIRDGILYEGTGLRGRSTLRKVTLETGEVLQSINLPENFFGEGIVELNGKVYQITWQEKTGFIYDFTTFEKLGEFSYETEGWGLTHDGQQLILSDGTDQLYFLDPLDPHVTDQVAVSDDRGPVYRINELEYVDGEVWGNIYQTACIARIDPKNGKVTGWIDLTGLHDLAIQASQAPVPPEVPNGIAYDPAAKRIFVTGKFWSTLYEITLAPGEAQP